MHYRPHARWWNVRCCFLNRMAAFAAGLSENLMMETSVTSSTTARIVGEGRMSTSGPGPEVMAASSLEGDSVISMDGDDVGKIKEIMLDVVSGRVAYAVLSSGGFLGMGGKLLAIPWSALTLDTDNKCFRLGVSSEQVRNAPGFDKDSWPSMADSIW